MKAYFVRHGDKQKGEYYNPSLRHRDEPLSGEGVLRARRLRRYFEPRPIGAIYASEYQRTAQTARFVAEDKRLEIVRDRRLNEIDNGVIESMTESEVRAQFPGFWEEFHSFSRDVRFPEGETGEEVRLRQAEFLGELARKGQDALAFCHEGYMRLLACHLLGLPVYRRNLFKVDLCGIAEIEYCADSGSWRLIRFNQTVD